VKLLVVDDSATMRKIIGRNLNKGAYRSAEILEAGDGKAALELLKAEPVDLILSDVNMPNLNGLELLDALRADAKLAAIPVIMITTEASPDAIRDMSARGAKACVAKPFTPEQLEEAIEALKLGA
jgi:two-component system chemotaxis response regulator CheY